MLPLCSMLVLEHSGNNVTNKLQMAKINWKHWIWYIWISALAQVTLSVQWGQYELTHFCCLGIWWLIWALHHFHFSHCKAHHWHHWSNHLPARLLQASQPLLCMLTAYPSFSLADAFMQPTPSHFRLSHVTQAHSSLHLYLHHLCVDSGGSCPNSYNRWDSILWWAISLMAT